MTDMTEYIQKYIQHTVKRPYSQAFHFRNFRTQVKL